MSSIADACLAPEKDTVQNLVVQVTAATFKVSKFGVFALGSVRDNTGTIDYLFEGPPQGMDANSLKGQTVAISSAQIQIYNGKKRIRFDAAAFALAAGSPLPSAAPAPQPTPYPQQQQAPAGTSSVPSQAGGFQHLPAPSLPQPPFLRTPQVQLPAGTPTLADCLRLIERATPSIGQALELLSPKSSPESRVAPAGALLSTLLIAYTNGKLALPHPEVDDDIPF